MNDIVEGRSALIRVIIKLRKIIKRLSIALTITVVVCIFMVGLIYLFDLFGVEVGSYDTTSEHSVVITDEQIQAIWDEFEKNEGATYGYGAGHGDAAYGDCLSKYDCSSWVIHCLYHAGIKTIADNTASGLYNDECIAINENDRQAGDLIFLTGTNSEKERNFPCRHLFGNI